MVTNLVHGKTPHLSKACSFHLRSFVTTGDIKIHDEHHSRIKNNKLPHGSCQTAIKTLTPGRSQTYPMANLVMYCGIIVELRKAFRATFVCSIFCTHVERTSYTNATYTARSIEAHLCHKLYIVCTYIGLKCVSEYCAVK